MAYVFPQSWVENDHVGYVCRTLTETSGRPIRCSDHHGLDQPSPVVQARDTHELLNSLLWMHLCGVRQTTYHQGIGVPGDHWAHTEQTGTFQTVLLPSSPMGRNGPGQQCL